MSGQWGFAAGVMDRQAFDQERTQSKGLYELQMAEGAEKLEIQKFELDNAKLTQKRQETALKLFSLAQPGATDKSDPTARMSSTLYQLADSEFQSGLIEQGSEHAKLASSIQANHSKIVGQTTTDAIKRYTFFGDLIKDVQPGDQEGFERAKMIYQSTFPGEKLDPKVANQPFTAEFKKTLESGTQTQLQKAQTEAAKAREVGSAATAAGARARIEYDKGLLKVAQDREARLAKNGGKPALPKAGDVTNVTALVTHDYPDIQKDQARMLSEPIAEEAARLIKDQNMPPGQAYRKAYNQAKARGDFWGMKSARSRAGETAEKPLDIPMVDGKPDVANMTGNMYYQDPRYPGAAFIFDKGRGGLVRVSTSKASDRGLAPDATDPDDPDADNDETDE